VSQEAVNRPFTALLVEDSEVFRTIIKLYLGQTVSVVLEADDGDTALKAMSENAVDLVVSDLSMPRMNGIELLKQIRSSPDRRVRSMPFVLLTAKRDSALIDEARRAGVSEFVHKPVKPSALKDVLQRVLGRAA